jgi:hypothetical protein
MRSMDLTLDDGTQIEVGTHFDGEVTLAIEGQMTIDARKIKLTPAEATALAGLLKAAAMDAAASRSRRY